MAVAMLNSDAIDVRQDEGVEKSDSIDGVRDDGRDEGDTVIADASSSYTVCTSSSPSVSPSPSMITQLRFVGSGHELMRTRRGGRGAWILSSFIGSTSSLSSGSDCNVW